MRRILNPSCVLMAPPRTALAIFALVGLADAAPALSFVANAAGPQTPLTFAILDCVGTGHAALALRSDYRAHLTAVQRDIGFRSIRGHGSELRIHFDCATSHA